MANLRVPQADAIIVICGDCYCLPFERIVFRWSGSGYAGLRHQRQTEDEDDKQREG